MTFIILKSKLKYILLYTYIVYFFKLMITVAKCEFSKRYIGVFIHYPSHSANANRELQISIELLVENSTYDMFNDYIVN